ncbi:hypothetical protein SAMN05216232_1959 [Virgibacillus subterraneus]|uniref:Uncharacterized protein n=1 Tax=Virgibacillus subterraneus TaxID=621109 RepID=A0A1H9EAM9_9BACI|nr:hypothetical protein [Virgibacillus subterraneus]SEQ22715.1 hypothetical protein SAMN05216232_1959 [Virgibacillus subterraneus]
MMNKHNVLLPKWIFEKSNNEKEVQALVLDYMQRYPEYNLISINNGFAICESIQQKRGE